MMANKNQVTLTFAGDSDQLEKTFDNVGDSSKSMSDDVGRSSRSMGDEMGAGFNKGIDAADDLDTKAMGFRDTMTGVEDTMKGVGDIAKGNLFEGFLTLGMGVGDLASGFANFLIPAVKNATKAGIANAVGTVRQTTTNAVHKVSLVASTIATKAMTVAQKGLNLAMRANPIGLVITAIALLVGGIILAYKKSQTFRNIVQGAMRGVRTAFGWVVDKGKDLVGWFKKLPGKIRGFFSGLGDVITAPFKAAFGLVKSLWNNTVGGFGFSVPGWVPVVGGKSFSIPRMHTGGIVSGARGQESLAILEAGERVTPANGSGVGSTIVLKSDGTRLSDLLMEILREAIREEGGDPVEVLQP